MSTIYVERITFCKECGKRYSPIKSWQKFCSAHCRVMNWEKDHPRIKMKELNKIINKS